MRLVRRAARVEQQLAGHARGGRRSRRRCPAAATGTCPRRRRVEDASARRAAAAKSRAPAQVPADRPRVAHLDRGDPPAGDPAGQALPDRLHLGQLRHGSARRRPRRGRRRRRPVLHAASSGPPAVDPEHAGLPAVAPVLQRRPGRLGGPLLGLLLAAPLGAAVPLAGHHHPGGERLGVVRAGLVDRVLRARRARSAAVSSCRLVFQSRPAPRPADSAISGSKSRWITLAAVVQPVLQVDRAEQRLQRVGQDARLVPAAGGLLALAEQQVRRRAAGPSRAPRRRARAC